MKGDTVIVTAANSKTMNAIENDRLYAAATDTGSPVDSFKDEKNKFNTVSQERKHGKNSKRQQKR